MGLSVQEKKCNTDFQDSGHLGFVIGMILALFYLRHPDASYHFESIGLSILEKPKIDFQDGGRSGHLGMASGPRVKLAGCKSALNPRVVYSTDHSKAVVPVLILLFVALWIILGGY